MKEKHVMILMTVCTNAIKVYFDTFFVFYFFNVANYAVLPLAKYYVTVYTFLAISTFLIRNFMKKNIKVPYFRIGISLEALYIALIMLMKDKIIDYVYLVAIVKGIAEGVFYFPKNLLDTEKISNEERQKYSGITNTITKVIAVIVPLILGYGLTYMTYTEMGKIFFLIFILMFIMSFYLKPDEYESQKKVELKDFWTIAKSSKKIKMCLLGSFCSGMTYSSGVMLTLFTLAKINVFKTNLNLGFIDSACAIIYLLLCILYTKKIKRDHFSSIVKYSGIISFITLCLFAFFPSIITLVGYLLNRNSMIGFMQLVTSDTSLNLSNDKALKTDFKSEFFLMRELIINIARVSGYLLLLIVCYLISEEYINYILILPATCLLFDGYLLSKLNKTSEI